MRREKTSETEVRLAANELYSAYSTILKNEKNVEYVLLQHMDLNIDEATKLLNDVEAVKNKLRSVISRMTDELNEDDKNQYILDMH